MKNRWNYTTLALLTCSLVGLLLVACTKPKDDPEEDYDTLFPFKGIEKPLISFEEQNLLHCDPQIDKIRFRYPGVNITENIREYDLTLTCSYKKGEDNQKPTFVVKYIGEDQKLHYVVSNPNTENKDVVMEEDSEYTVSFRVKSGFPMYLSVSGSGVRGSQIEARIGGKCTDGYTVVKMLESVQFLNQEGVNNVPEPYCNYVILP
jgi:hypothetical protein